ncbi:hypothetical protein [Paenibacillus sp. WLX2291]|uniref:hypothetical protein n=1 Tax=Paenibacillus sp. WLX2291 TaxID=3296934 RepID=UPI003983F245
MDTRKSYEEVLGYPPDFRVRYRFYSPDEGGRRVLPWQGYRPDFAYEMPVKNVPAKQGDTPAILERNGKYNDVPPNVILSELYMIHPEFEDEQGAVILQIEPVPSTGTASMWIVIPERRRQVHIHQIQIGTRAYMMEGARAVAEMEVIEIVGLHSNPTGTM